MEFRSSPARSEKYHVSMPISYVKPSIYAHVDMHSVNVYRASSYNKRW